MNQAKLLARTLSITMIASLSLISAVQASAQSDDDVEDGPSRVARLALVSGDVSVLEPEGEDWQSADQNEPLFEGYEIYVGQNGRAEIALGARSYLRIANGADVTFTGLDSGWVQLSVASGTAVLSIESAARGEQYSLSAPAAAVTPSGAGIYRVDIADNGDTWVTLQRGSAEVSTPAGAFEALEGDVATVGYDDPADVDLVGDAARDYQDDIDGWVSERSDYYADLNRRDQPGPVLALGDRDDIYGLSELASYGTWLGLGNDQYGWQPQYARDPSWSPYQDGYWDYSTVTGYTWVSNEPWGWAPYHYGRWNYDDRAGWVWLPTHGSRTSFGAGQTARYQWKPALVYLWQAPETNSYTWVPLAPGERYVPFSEPTIASARRPQRSTATEAFRPRYLQERRGVISLSPTALVARQKPAKAASANTRATVPLPTAQMTAARAVELPKPARAAAVVAPARVKPSVAVRQRAVVVDTAAAASAPKPTSPASQALRAQTKPARAERKAERRALKPERKADTGQGTTAAQPAPRTATGASASAPTVVRPGGRGGRKQAATAPGQTVRAPADDATGTPAPRGNRGNGRNRDATTEPAAPAAQPPPARTTAPAERVDPGTPTTTDRSAPATGKGNGQGKGQGKNKNRPKPGDPATPSSPASPSTPTPTPTDRPSPQ